jgi:hypothetical protein
VTVAAAPPQPGKAADAARRVRGALRRGGAGQSGLGSLTELCALNAAGDCLVAIALATTVFFNVPAGEARGRMALYLITTMAPFALLAPVIGPLLDRFHGRRVALGATMIVRAGLCWALAGHTKGLEIFPLALAVLVSSRGFGIARAAVTPRVLPAGLTLVKANARVTLVGSIGGAVIAPIGVGLQILLGVDWVLRAAALVFLLGVLVCTQLPAHVDSAAGERPARGISLATFTGSLRPNLGGLPIALRAVMPMRALAGFLFLFLAFELRSGPHGKAGLAYLAIAAGLGQPAGVLLGSRLGARRPELLISAALTLATVSCVFAGLTYSLPTSLVAMAVATLCASLGKLSLDAVIQRDIPEDVRTSAFARSETALQLSWVSGGALGLLPISGTIALTVAGLGMIAALVIELTGVRHQHLREAHPPAAPHPPTAPRLPAADPGGFPGSG